jgi:protein-S-isoprenylcysteine O-methyltransferase
MRTLPGSFLIGALPVLLHEPLAHWLIVSMAVVVVIGEVVATLLGNARDGRVFGGLADAFLLSSRHHGTGVRKDRGTRLVFALGAYLAIIAAIAIAKVPDLRAGANNWWAFGLGLVLVLAGVLLRGWAIFSLGRYFRRTVTIEPEQRLVRRGPYRLLRHPSYTGLLLIFAGFGLAIGSWLGAVVALLIAFAGTLPRIRVEETALAEKFGDDYTDYANSTDRLVPRVW